MKKTLLTLLLAVMALGASAQSPAGLLHHVAASAAAAAPAAADEISISYDVISTQPEGELCRFTRHGSCYHAPDNYSDLNPAGMTVSVVFDRERGVAYFRDLVMGSDLDTWVKAYIEGDKLRLPMFQCIFNDPAQGYGTMLCRITMDDGQPAVDLGTTDMYYTMHDDGSISLDGTADGAAMLGLVFTDDLQWTKLADYETTFRPFTDEPLLVPDGLSVDRWSIRYYNNNTYWTDFINVATDYANGKIYLVGIVEADCAVVGTVDEADYVTFAADQFMGESEGRVIYLGVATSGDYYASLLPEARMKVYRDARYIELVDNFTFFTNRGKVADGKNMLLSMGNPSIYYSYNAQATPVDPCITSFEASYNDCGYNTIGFDIRLLGTEGEILGADDAYYALWVKVNGEPQRYEFQAADYGNVFGNGAGSWSEVNYLARSISPKGYPEVTVGGKLVCLYHAGYDDIGVQTIYYGGYERNVSNIVWMGHTDGLDSELAPAAEPSARYDLHGRRVGARESGIGIVRDSDGVRKVIR